MTVSITTTTSPDDAVVRRRAIGQLARIESSRMLRSAPIWIGLALTVLLAVTGALSEEEWSAQKYNSLVPLSVFPLTIGAFIAGVRSGNRDRSHRRPPLSEEAALDGDERAWARLSSLLVPVGMAALAMLVIGVASRIEGGFWIGDSPRRTDTALPSVFELVQPVLSVAVTGAAGLAIGRAVRRSGPAIVIGGAALFFSGLAYWIWNSAYAYSTALMQIQPLEVDLPASTNPSAVPEDWLVNRPNEYSGWRRSIVHTPTVIFHNLYLLGLVGLFSGLALRHRPRARMIAAGAAVAVLAVIAQLAVSPH